MKFHESAKRLEQIESGFNDATVSLTQIFGDLKLTSDVQVPEYAPRTEKYAASAALISEISQVMRQASESPDSITVAIQLAKIGDKVRIGLPGGAILSVQELNWMAASENAGKVAPPNLFYLLAQDQLAHSGDIKFSYDLDLASARFGELLQSNLARELGEELGEGAARQVVLGDFLAGDRTTTLSSIKLPDAATSKEIALQLHERGVTLDDKGSLRGIYTTVTEKVAVAFGPLGEIESLATNNEEAKGMRVKPLAELLAISRQTAESVETFRDFKQHHSERHGSDGIRNPSTTWGLGLLAGWLKEQIIGADTYREGPRAYSADKTKLSNGIPRPGSKT